MFWLPASKDPISSKRVDWAGGVRVRAIEVIHGELTGLPIRPC